MGELDTLHGRLRWARERAGYRSATDAARAMNISEPTYLGHENGSRGFRQTATRYAQFFRVSLVWLLNGTGMPDEREVIDKFNRLSPENQIIALKYMDFLDQTKR